MTAALTQTKRPDPFRPQTGRRVVVLGGAGFVGLNIAETFQRRGHDVVLFDRSPPPADFPEPVQAVVGDVRDSAALGALLTEGVDVLVLGAAVTAGPSRERSDPDTILAVNLAALPPILALARDHGVRRIVNLSSAAVYGASAATGRPLDETMPAEPESLYAITKFASERVATRLGALWSLDVVNLRLSAVFGPWERDTGVRDTLSAPAQIMSALAEGRPALLARPGERDWIDVRDVAEAVLAVAVAAGRPAHTTYNVSTGTRWSALDFGQALARLRLGFVCRLAESDETPTIDLHSGFDRPALTTQRLAAEFGWTARFGLADSATDLLDWQSRHDQVRGS